MISVCCISSHGGVGGGVFLVRTMARHWYCTGGIPGSVYGSVIGLIQEVRCALDRTRGTSYPPSPSSALQNRGTPGQDRGIPEDKTGGTPQAGQDVVATSRANACCAHAGPCLHLVFILKQLKVGFSFQGSNLKYFSVSQSH